MKSKYFFQLVLLFLISNLLAFSLSAQWTQLGLDIDGEVAGDFSGNSALAASGNRVAIGASFNDGNGTNSGHVRVFEWNGTSWVQLGMDIDGEAAGDESGGAVYLSSSGNRLAVGAVNNDGNGTSSGHVRVFEWNGTSWVQLGMDIDGEAAGDQSGNSVSLSASGNRVAIGASGNNGNGSFSGHARIFEWTGIAWTQLGMDIDAEAAEDFAGSSVSLSSSGSRVAVGAFNNDGNGLNSGHVRIFEWNGASWTQLGMDINGESSADQSGSSVSLSSSGNHVAIGARNNSGNGLNSGHVRVFEWNGSNWTQLGMDIDGEAAGDNSGTSVSLSSAGNLVAIGANNNDGNGSNSGHVRVFEWNGASWVQLEMDIDGEAVNDNSGISVSLSSTGNRVAIGASLNAGNGSLSGHVRVFQSFVSPPPVPTLSQWGLILLSLLTFSFGLLFIKAPKTQLAGHGGMVTLHSTLQNIPFDKKRYCLVLAWVFALIVAGFTLGISLFGYQLTQADIPGIFLCTPVLAYLVFLYKQ